MATVNPFCGLRYDTEKFPDLNAVTAPPYDDVSAEKQQALYEKSDYNVIRLDLGVDLPEDTETENRYTRSAAYMKRWMDEKKLVLEEKPAFYICEQIFSMGDERPSHSIKGIIGAVRLEEFSQEGIVPHEETISKVKEDRMQLMKATASNLSSVYALYMDDDKTVARLLEEQSDRTPDLAFVTDENVNTRIWIVTDEDLNCRISGLFGDKQLFVADGHHRYETALAYSRMRHKEDGTADGTMAYDYVMMMLVSMSDGGLFIFPTHRMIRGLERFDETLLIGRLTEEFTISKIYFTEGDYAEIITDRLANSVNETLFGLYTGMNHYYLLKLKDSTNLDLLAEGKSEAYKHLDVTVLHKLILEKYMGIDEESVNEQRNLVYTHDAHHAVEAVQRGDFNCVFLMNPPKLSEIKAVAQANEKMPQKSTHFWPKPVTGIVMNKFE